MAKPTYVVGIGASAGGLEAIQAFFDHMPEKSGLAFVVIQHLSPDFKSMMVDLLGRNTKMSVQQAEHDVEIHQDNVYLIPPGKTMTIDNGCLKLLDRQKTRVPEKPIDCFFTSLALDYKEKAIAVVLSGTGSDGTSGTLDINEHGGLVIVQDAKDAKFDGMPRNALASGMVNKTLPATEIPGFILSYTLAPDNPLMSHERAFDAPDFHGEYPEIFQQIYNRFRIDMDDYKSNTINRRIVRRIRALMIHNPEEYVTLLQEDEDEVEALFQDLIIGVTTFFRDPDSFDFLKLDVIPKLVRRADREIRIWSCGCSTGEEPYSIAMLLREYLDNHNLSIPVKIFATDLTPGSVRFASQGSYSEAQISSLPEHYRTKYFNQHGEFFEVNKVIRNMLVFSSHNVLSEPPFTKLDLITCRNMLIYFNNKAQAKVLRNFHFGLSTGSWVFLGSSESLGPIESEFEALSTKHNVYRKVSDARIPPDYAMKQPEAVYRTTRTAAKNAAGGLNLIDYDGILQELITNGFIVNHINQVTHVYGNARELIRIPEGRLGGQTDVLQVVREDLRVLLNAGLIKAKRDKARVVLSNVSITIDDTPQAHEIIIRPLSHGSPVVRNFLVLLKEINHEPVEGEQLSQIHEGDIQLISELQNELQFARESLSATVEEVETSNEELQSTNEELLASNEELQSTNEELQSVNEELYTVNAEHQAKIEELQRLNADIDNLLKSTEIATIFLNDKHEIRKFTPEVSSLFSLVEHDIGRPINHFTHSLLYENLINDTNRILGGSTVLLERPLTDVNGHSYLLRLTPYVNEGEIEGVVLSFVNTDEITRVNQELEESESRYRTFFNSAPIYLVALDAHKRIEAASDRWLTFMGYEREDVIGKASVDVLFGGDDHALATFLSAVEATPNVATQMHTPVKSFKKNGDTVFSKLSTIPYEPEPDTGTPQKLLTGIEDITAEYLARQENQQMAIRLETALQSASIGIWEVDHEGKMSWDSSMKGLLGYDDSTLTQDAIDRFYTADRKAELNKLVEQIENVDETSRYIEIEYQHPSGKQMHLAVYGYMIEGTLLGITRDVTDELLVEKEEERHQLELLKANRLTNVGTMAAGVAHEINNPLSVIMTHAQTLQLALEKDLLPPEKVQASLQEIQATTERIGTIITGLRNFSRDASNDKPALVNIDSVIEDATTFCRAKLRKDDVSLTHANSGSRLMVTCRAVEISQILVNLIDNARDSVSENDAKWIVIEAFRSDAGIAISVTDSGSGIAPEHREKIFDPFYTTKDIGQGTGLGLSICKGIAESHNGSLALDTNHPNTRFVLTLPAV